MAENKNSFVLYCNQQALFNELSDEEAGQLIKQVFSYVNDENPEDLPERHLQIAFVMIRTQLKFDLKRWDEKVEKRRNNGHLGGLKSGEVRAKKKANEANEANASKTKQTKQMLQSEANEAVNVIVTDNVNGNVNVDTNVSIYRRFDHLKITASEIDKLKADGYKQEEIDSILDEIENYKGNKNYKSLYLTAKNWLKNRNEKTQQQAAETEKRKFRINSPAGSVLKEFNKSEYLAFLKSIENSNGQVTIRPEL